MKTIRRTREDGFTLVELMVVVAMVGILAAVAVPAYINYINRVKQSEATSQLLTARIEMEEFYADNGRYAGTIGCLPSFKGDDACLTNCAGCNHTSHRLRYYTFRRAGTLTSSYYRIAATRRIYSYAADDQVSINTNSQVPEVANTDALKFSVYKWLFQ